MMWCDETDPHNGKDLPQQPNRTLRQTFLEPVYPHNAEDDAEDAEGHDDQNSIDALRVQTHVPDSWEELLVEDDDAINKTNYDDHLLYPSIAVSPHAPAPTRGGGWALERLELGRFPLLDVDVLRQVLGVCPLLTHLGLSGSLTYDRGPDVLWNLSEWVPRLQVLDVSGNTGWITEPLLRSVYESYMALRVGGGGATIAFLDGDEGDHPQPPERPQKYQHILIKATGCLVRSSQLVLEAEYGTLF